MAKCNYKMYASIGWSPAVLHQHLAVMDTGAVGNFFRTSVLPVGLQSKIQKGLEPNIRESKSLPLYIE